MNKNKFGASRQRKMNVQNVDDSDNYQNEF